MGIAKICLENENALFVVVDKIVDATEIEVEINVGMEVPVYSDYAEPLHMGIPFGECEISNEYASINGVKALQELGRDDCWAAKARRLGVSPLRLTKSKRGVRAELDCVHKELWETLPEYVSIVTDSDVIHDCLDKNTVPNCIAVVEAVPECWIPVYEYCVQGTCDCEYVLGGVLNDLKPCRFVSKSLSFMEICCDDLLVVTGVCRGFQIVDKDCLASYNGANYPSITCGAPAVSMTELVRKELCSGKVRKVSMRPRCVHSMGAVEKTDGSLRPVTDCSRPEGQSINSFMTTTCKKFHYKNLDQVVEMLNEGDYGSVLDISEAYRTVAILPSQRTLQGFAWNSGQGEEWYEDMRLCFGGSSSPYLFTKITDFVVKCGGYEGYPDAVN